MLLADHLPGSFVNNDGSQQTPYSDYDWQNDKRKYLGQSNKGNVFMD